MGVASAAADRKESTLACSVDLVCYTNLNLTCTKSFEHGAEEMIEIDGGYGEGGGQILRTALSFSCILKIPFRLYNIRKRREPSGLRPQHLMAVNAARTIAGADISGAHIGSRELLFKPTQVTAGHYRFDIGTAGSTSLVLQTLLPPLLLAEKKSIIDLIGGTHVPFSPSFHFMEKIFMPMLRRLGCDIRLHMETCGFYPRGGGRIRAEISPVRELLPVSLTERGEIVEVRGVSAVANLPEHIAVRQLNAATEILAKLGCPLKIAPIHLPATGRGSFIILFADAAHSLAGFDALGEPGKPAEKVGREAASELIMWHETEAALDRHLADQLVIYLALCSHTSSFTTAAVTRHLLTNLWVAESFGACNYEVEGGEGSPGKITIIPAIPNM